MRLLEILQGFIDLFRSRYVRYLEKEVVRLRQENAGINSTLLGTKGIGQVASPDLQDLQARGIDLRKPRRQGEEERPMRPVSRGGTVAKWRNQMEARDRREALELEAEIRAEKEKKEAINAP